MGLPGFVVTLLKAGPEQIHIVIKAQRLWRINYYQAPARTNYWSYKKSPVEKATSRWLFLCSLIIVFLKNYDIFFSIAFKSLGLAEMMFPVSMKLIFPVNSALMPPASWISNAPAAISQGFKLYSQKPSRRPQAT